jgi:hypothetical protein
MQRLSSRRTYYDKRITPIVMCAVLLGFGAAAAIHDPPPFPLVSLVLLAIVFFAIIKFVILDLADEVWDAGDALIVRNKGQEDRIPLAAISKVRYSPYKDPRVTLWLRTPSLFGEKITFAAPIRFIPSPGVR